MARPCKVCTSQLKDEINTLIMQGVPFNVIHKTANDKGLDVSEMAIIRHANKHLEGYIPRNEVKIVNQVDIEQQPTETSINPVIIDISGIEQIESGYDLSKYAKAIMPRIIAYGLMIVKHKLALYTQGKCKFPDDEIRGLNNLISIADKVTNRSYYNKVASSLFSFDDALQDTPKTSGSKNDDLASVLKTLSNF